MSGEKVLCAAVLRNPSTPAAALEQLAGATEIDFRRRVAANSTTPPTALARLAQDADEEVRTKVGSNPSTETATLLALAGDKADKVRNRVAERARCPLEVLTLLCKDPSAYIRMDVVRNAAFPNREHNERKLRWLLRKHEGAWHDASSMPSVFDVADAQIPPEELRPYAERRDAAPETLIQLAAHTETKLRADAAAHSKTPPDVLRQLADDSDPGVRRQVALNPGMPADRFATFAVDPDVTVRTCLAAKQPLPAEILDQLLRDEDPEVQIAALCSPHLSGERKDAEVRARFSMEFVKKIEHNLKNFPEPTVLWLLDQHAKLAEAYSLRNYPSAAVQGKMIELLSGWARTFFIYCKGSDLRQREAEPLTDEQMLKLAEPNGKYPDHERERLAQKLAEYPAISANVLEILARRQLVPEVPRGRRYQSARAQAGGSLAMIAAHPRTPPTLLAELAQYWNKRVRLAALNNPNTPPEARAARAQHVISEAARSSSLLGRVCALSHASAPAAALRRAAFDGTWTERFAVAQNPQCPRDLLALLREDANVAVRDAARGQWQARFAADEP